MDHRIHKEKDQIYLSCCNLACVSLTNTNSCFANLYTYQPISSYVPAMKQKRFLIINFKVLIFFIELLLLLLLLNCFLIESTKSLKIKGTVFSAENNKLTLPLTNVSIINAANKYNCTPLTQLTTYPDGIFEIECNIGSNDNYNNNPHILLNFYARQYNETMKKISLKTIISTTNIYLDPRPMIGFPAASWRFEGWVLQAETRDIPNTNITFLSHPSAYRTPSGRIFVISTAGALHSQRPGWTQCYWQEENQVEASGICNDGKPLIDESHPGVIGSSMSARLIFADNRLLMVTGIEKLTENRMVTILENKNLNDPSNPNEWKGLGVIKVNFTGAPTKDHEDYRLHILEEDEQHHYMCNGVKRKYWLLVIPDNAPNEPGRACGRMAFASATLLGPYEWCNYAVNPNGTQCHAFPGDIIFDRSSDQMYFVESYGSIYRSLSNDGPLKFQEIPGKIVKPGPPGSYDDLGDVALTFLLPSVLKTTSIMRNISRYHLRLGDDDDNNNIWTLNNNRVRLYHATYSTVNHNPNVTKKADFGYKEAIGMYTFDWPN